jgi:hypothetical protein
VTASSGSSTNSVASFGSYQWVSRSGCSDPYAVVTILPGGMRGQITIVIRQRDAKPLAPAISVPLGRIMRAIAEVPSALAPFGSVRFGPVLGIGPRRGRLD